MKIVRVVAAVIESDHKIFATQRGYGEFKGGWEFPGGKIEPGETPQQALVREIEEELDTERIFPLPNVVVTYSPGKNSLKVSWLLKLAGLFTVSS